MTTQEKATELVRLWKEFAISKTTIASERFREIFDGATERDVSTMVNTIGEDRDMLVDVLLDVVESQVEVSNVFLALSEVSKSDSASKSTLRLGTRNACPGYLNYYETVRHWNENKMFLVCCVP